MDRPRWPWWMPWRAPGRASHTPAEVDLEPLLASLTPEERSTVTATQIRIALTVAQGFMPTVIGAMLVTAVVNQFVDVPMRRELGWAWATGMSSMALAVAWFAARALGSCRAPDDWLRAGRQLEAITIAYSLGWGVGCWVFLGQAAAVPVAPVVIVMVIVIASSSPTSVHRPTHARFLLPVTVLVMACLVVLGGTVNLSLACGVAIAAWVVWHYAGIHRDAITANIAMRMQSDKLLARVTEQQRTTDDALHEAQVSREAAEAANRGKSAFLAAAGHDLRQPMHALVQYHGHLQKLNQDPRLADTVLRIGRSLESMQELLDSVLEISRLMMGAVRPQPAPFALTALFDRLDAQMRPIADGKGLALYFDVTCAIVHTDEVLLERILRNLVLNAIRYTPSGRVSVDCRRRGGVMRVAVCDTGIGIPRALQAKVFEEFFQVDNSARDSRRGLGLGLSLVSQLCTLLDLRLRLRSQPGRGSVFMIDVPMGATPPAPSPVRRPAATDYVRGACVLLIDDNPASLDATADSLRLFGCRVLTAASGIEAIDRLQQQEWMPNLVISDYRLGDGETGIEAVRMVAGNLRALLGDEFELPALIVSGDTSPVEIGRVRDAGLVMLHKPLKLDVLYEAVNGALRRLARAETA